MGRLNGRVAIVTHGSSSLSRGIAARLSAEGATVVTVDSTAADIASPLDSKAEAERVAAEVLRRHSRIDILVNGSEEALAFAPLEHKSSVLGSAAQTVLWTMQAVLPSMRQQHDGRIVNLVATFGDSLYRQLADTVATSEAVKSLTRSAAEEWGQHNILVNALATAADSDAWRRLREQAPEAADALVAGTPMGRMGDPEADIGGAVLLLVTDSGRFLTGHVLYADGGQHLTPTPFEALVPLE